MRTIINLFLHGLVLWVAWQLFPDIVQFDGMGTLVLVTVLLWVISLVIGLIVVLLFGLSVLAGVDGNFGGCITAAVGIALCFGLMLFADVIGLDFLSHQIQGFMIVGFWPKVLLAILLSVFSIGSTAKYEYA